MWPQAFNAKNIYIQVKHFLLYPKTNKQFKRRDKNIENMNESEKLLFMQKSGKVEKFW